ncbi:hypothetical protein CC117_04310 [Parafrankia colletiae]|uniref:PH domain-containing protein n=2 Tax=Parafrankia colletiae TaxID=573497 RepID=A0A1S1R0F2_9ACTN|nr:hypothetical protein CC117_04310 [Parafrankia colletiae]
MAALAVFSVLILAGLWLHMSRLQNRIIVVTDRAILVLRAGLFAWATPSAEAPLARLPRETALGPLRGPYGSLRLAGEKLWISFPARRRVAAADAILAGSHRGRAGV